MFCTPSLYPVGMEFAPIAQNLDFFVSGGGWGVHTYFSLIKDLNKRNDVNTMYMYSLNFMYGLKYIYLGRANILRLVNTTKTILPIWTNCCFL